MEHVKNQIIALSSEDYTIDQLVTFLELIVSRIELDTISEMARKEGKTPNGIKASRTYKKIKIGKQLMCIKGAKESDLPF